MGRAWRHPAGRTRTPGRLGRNEPDLARARPELARLLNRLRAGNTLVVVHIDRLARSLSHLLSVIEHVREAGGHFRSLGDPIDTAGPSGMLVLQIMAPSRSSSGR